jgi:hypothetical protein
MPWRRTWVGRTEGPLFITRTGARLREPEVWKLLRRLAKRAALPQADTVHPHVLRHGFITDALEQGTPLHVVQDAAGHKDPRTTQRYNRARKRLDGHPAYTVAAAMAERLEHRIDTIPRRLVAAPVPRAVPAVRPVSRPGPNRPLSANGQVAHRMGRYRNR